MSEVEAMTPADRIAWVLECGCEPDYEHCTQCDARRKLRERAERQDRWQAMADELRRNGWTITREFPDGITATKYE